VENEERAVQLSPNDRRLRDNLETARSSLFNKEGNRLYKAGEYNAAIDYYERALELNPNDRIVKWNLAGTRGDLLHQEGHQLRNADDLRGALEKERMALKQFELQLSLDPSDVTPSKDATTSRNRIANMEGLLSFRKGDFLEALNRFKAALVIDPDNRSNNYNVHNTEAQIAFKAGNYQQAQAKVEEALRYAEKPTASLQRLIDDLSRREAERVTQEHAAKEALSRVDGREAKQDGPNQDVARAAVKFLNAAVGLYAKGDMRGAVENLESVVRLQPFNHEAARLLGEVRGELGDNPERGGSGGNESPGAQVPSAEAHSKEAARLARMDAFAAAANEARKQFDTGGISTGSLQYPAIKGERPTTRGFASLSAAKQQAILSTTLGQQLVINETALQTKVQQLESKVRELEGKLTSASPGDRGALEVDVVGARTERDKAKQEHVNAQRQVEDEAERFVLR
jgi:tetratricopeptide (TPR) repeat protein